MDKLTVAQVIVTNKLDGQEDIAQTDQNNIIRIFDMMNWINKYDEILHIFQTIISKSFISLFKQLFMI